MNKLELLNCYFYKLKILADYNQYVGGNEDIEKTIKSLLNKIYGVNSMELNSRLDKIKNIVEKLEKCFNEDVNIDFQQIDEVFIVRFTFMNIRDYYIVDEKYIDEWDTDTATLYIIKARNQHLQEQLRNNATPNLSENLMDVLKHTFRGERC